MNISTFGTDKKYEAVGIGTFDCHELALVDDLELKVKTSGWAVNDYRQLVIPVSLKMKTIISTMYSYTGKWSFRLDPQLFKLLKTPVVVSVLFTVSAVRGMKMLGDWTSDSLEIVNEDGVPVFHWYRGKPVLRPIDGLDWLHAPDYGQVLLRFTIGGLALMDTQAVFKELYLNFVSTGASIATVNRQFVFNMRAVMRLQMHKPMPTDSYRDMLYQGRAEEFASISPYEWTDGSDSPSVSSEFSHVSDFSSFFSL